MITKGLFTSDKDYWETPQSLFDELDAEFHFNLDPCCTHENAKCKDHYTIEEDGLKQKWGRRVFCNPPYGKEIGKWVEKCYQEANPSKPGCKNGALYKQAGNSMPVPVLEAIFENIEI